MQEAREQLQELGLQAVLLAVVRDGAEQRAQQQEAVERLGGALRELRRAAHDRVQVRLHAITTSTRVYEYKCTSTRVASTVLARTFTIGSFCCGKMGSEPSTNLNIFRHSADASLVPIRVEHSHIRVVAHTSHTYAIATLGTRTQGRAFEHVHVRNEVLEQHGGERRRRARIREQLLHR